MRQAGRYLPEYNATRRKAGSFLALAKTPELACEVTLQPLERFALDAAIIFSDILTVPDAMGLGLYFAEGEGPRFERPVRDEGDVARLARARPGRAALRVRRGRAHAQGARRARAADRLLRQPLHARLLHGRRRRQRRLPPREDACCTRAPSCCTASSTSTRAAVTAYLNAQIAAGAQAVMIFDTWGGVLSDAAYARVLARLLEAGAARAHARARRPASCRASSSPRAAGCGSRRWPNPAPTRSASTGRPTSARRAGASATAWRCRATSIRWRSSARATAIEREVKRVLDALRRGSGPRLQPRPRRLAAHAAGAACRRSSRRCTRTRSGPTRR